MVISSLSEEQNQYKGAKTASLANSAETTGYPLSTLGMQIQTLLLFGHSVQFSSVQSLSCVQLFATPWTAACQASLSITNSQSLPKPMSTESVMPSNHLIRCCPLLFLPPIPPSIRVFSNESTLRIRWPKYQSFSFSISPSNEHPGLISFRMDWLDLLAFQGTLKSLLQHHISKVSIFQCSAFFTVQLSHPYMPTGKTIALTRWTFVDKVMSLLVNVLSRLVIAFLPRRKLLLISLDPPLLLHYCQFFPLCFVVFALHIEVPTLDAYIFIIVISSLIMPYQIQNQRQAMKEIIDRLYFSKMKNFCYAKDNIKRLKRPATCKSYI